MINQQTTIGTLRIALLIDGDNAQAALIEEILAETSKYGLMTIRRIYGDWTTPNMGSWKEKLHTYAIHPIQQFRYTTGKNATDSAMIIDAMDILYSGCVNSFCLVSSDSDYTRLATRIREKGFFVMGIGKKMTPRAFVNACDVFVYTENLISHGQDIAEAIKPEKSAGPIKSDPVPLLKNAFEMAAQDEEWASLGMMGTYLRQIDPSFDPRTYGHKKLLTLIQEHQEIFDVKKVKKRSDDTSVVYYAKLRTEI
ncbi:NYN domain-containing protein [Desulfonema magnum]|uniref:NYN domain-containing protein n=1 Tax=Desulfonema magnum TaxID=45655 RepID=A0A975GU96_9BACT|nr:NYN domain-containing protein [Desulfonema magnum]QTA93944.1 NYN domain-containing protein [Desulfonema magnum]